MPTAFVGIELFLSYKTVDTPSGGAENGAEQTRGVVHIIRHNDKSIKCVKHPKQRTYTREWKKPKTTSRVFFTIRDKTCKVKNKHEMIYCCGGNIIREINIAGQHIYNSGDQYIVMCSSHCMNHLGWYKQL